MEVSDSNPVAEIRTQISEKERIRVKRKTLQTVLEQCQRALELINASDEKDVSGCETMEPDQVPRPPDPEADELCDMLKSRVECPDFLEKLEYAQASVSQNQAEEGNSWHLISENDLLESDDVDSDQEDYVLVRQEDIVEGIACFLAAHLLSLKQTEILTPDQLQDGYIKTQLL